MKVIKHKKCKQYVPVTYSEMTQSWHGYCIACGCFINFGDAKPQELDLGK